MKENGNKQAAQEIRIQARLEKIIILPYFGAFK
jgi:hypothetical protein